ncbi:MAG: YqaA family protein [Myxococcaceae bacterium]
MTPSTSTPPSAYRRFYDRVAALANSPYAVAALVGVSIADASFFPVPPFALLVPMIVAQPRRWLWLTALAAVASFAGGALGYYIGVGIRHGAVTFLSVDLSFPIRVAWLGIDATLGQLLGQNFWFLALLCSVLPTPFKFVSIGSGLVGVPFLTFFLAAMIGRTARFALVCTPVAMVALRSQRARAAG